MFTLTSTEFNAESRVDLRIRGLKVEASTVGIESVHQCPIDFGKSEVPHLNHISFGRGPLGEGEEHRKLRCKNAKQQPAHFPAEYAPFAIARRGQIRVQHRPQTDKERRGTAPNDVHGSALIGRAYPSTPHYSIVGRCDEYGRAICHGGGKMPGLCGPMARLLFFERA